MLRPIPKKIVTSKNNSKLGTGTVGRRRDSKATRIFFPFLWFVLWGEIIVRDGPLLIF